jgi:hypothetical protein
MTRVEYLLYKALKDAWRPCTVCGQPAEYKPAKNDNPNWFCEKHMPSIKQQESWGRTYERAAGYDAMQEVEREANRQYGDPR